MHMFYITLFPPPKSPYRAFMWSVAQHFMLLLRMECSCCNFNKGIVFLQNPETRSNSILISQNYNFNKESIDIRHIMLNICRFYRNNFNISIQWIISGFWHFQVQQSSCCTRQSTLFTTDATASSRQQTEIQNRDAVLKSIRFQGYHSNKECTPFFQQGIETLKIYFVKTIN